MTSISNKKPLLCASVQEMIQAGQKLQRLVKLDKTLPPDDIARVFALEKLHNFSVQLDSQFGRSTPLPPSTLIRFYKEIREIQPQLPTLFHKFRTELYSEIENISDKIRLFLAEAKILFSSPVRKAERGRHGPTLLLSYPCIGPRKPEDCVIKWSTFKEHEHTSNFLYRKFSKFFAELFCGFSVPESACFDFKKCSYETADGFQRQLSPEEAHRIKKIFKEITTTVNPQKTAEKQFLLITEKIDGENFFDFIVSGRYKELNPEQKRKLFERLGRMAVLDAIFGIEDRMIPLYWNKDHYEIDSGVHANLSNIMITSDLVPFAIDNGVKPELIHDSFHKQQYLFFLKTLFTSKGSLKSFAKSILKASKNASSEIDELVSTRKDIQVGNMRKEWDDSFGKDLELSLKKKKRNSDTDRKEEDKPSFDALEALQKGLKDMTRSLQKNLLLNYWNTKEANSLKNRLLDLDPLFFEAVNERIETFSRLKI